MPQLISNKFKLDLAKLEQNALIELFEVDLRGLKDADGINGELYRFMPALTKNRNLSYGKERLMSHLLLKLTALKCQAVDQATDQL